MQLINRIITTPRLICLCTCLSFSVALSAIVYFQTKQSYKAVGFNNGSIEANMEVFKAVSSVVGEINTCDSKEESIDTIEMLRIKTKFLYLVKSPVNGTLSFCQL